jgi:dTDP-4-amino-4,6-dideoxygalactose transaminase
MIGPVEQFENSLSLFTGAPYVVATDCCTHAIELCFRLLGIKSTSFTSYTYISVPMTMNLLKVKYQMVPEEWKDEYQFHNTPVWDSARCLRPDMYQAGRYQCLSFGPGKPLDNVRGGAILLDNEGHYKKLKAMSYDGREIGHEKWTEQMTFSQGFHYMMRYEECDTAITKLKIYENNKVFDHTHQAYQDLRQYRIIN